MVISSVSVNGDEMPWCSKCKCVKDASVFGKDKRRLGNNRSGYRSWCKPCESRSTREWQANNQERYKARQAARQDRLAWKLKHPQLKKVIDRTGRRVCDAFKGRPHPPPKTLIGCSYKQLMEHLGELQEYDEIDHVIAVKYYDLDDPIDVMRAFNWQNTERLTRRQNAEKGSKLPCHERLQELKHLWPNAWWFDEFKWEEWELPKIR